MASIICLVDLGSNHRAAFDLDSPNCGDFAEVECTHLQRALKKISAQSRGVSSHLAAWSFCAIARPQAGLISSSSRRPSLSIPVRIEGIDFGVGQWQKAREGNRPEVEGLTSNPRPPIFWQPSKFVLFLLRRNQIEGIRLDYHSHVYRRLLNPIN